MAAPLSVTIQASGGGLAINFTQSVAATLTSALNPTLAAAKSGTLPTRTSNTVGTLTMDAGHGFATGDRIDLFWLDPPTGVQKCQHKITVGTVAGNSVPISGGLGDSLPPALTAVTVHKPTDYDVPLNTPDLLAVVVGGTAGGKVVLEKADGTVVYHQTLGANGAGAAWVAGAGASSPVSDTVARAWLSNASPTLVNAVSVLAGLSG
jgi:hypothetical protein